MWRGEYSPPMAQGVVCCWSRARTCANAIQIISHGKTPLGGWTEQTGCSGLQVRRQMRHAHVNMSRTPSENVCGQPHLTAQPCTHVSKCPHSATRPYPRRQVHISACHPVWRCFHSSINTGSQAHPNCQCSALQCSVSARSHAKFLFGVTALQSGSTDRFIPAYLGCLCGYLL